MTTIMFMVNPNAIAQRSSEQSNATTHHSRFATLHRHGFKNHLP